VNRREKSRSEIFQALSLDGRKIKTESITNNIGTFSYLVRINGGGRTGCDCVKTENEYFGALEPFYSQFLSRLSLVSRFLRKSKISAPDNIKIMATYIYVASPVAVTHAASCCAVVKQQL
jgi:hypothetical protein